MNQILVTEKLYVTPELKTKKKIYRLSFIISIFLIVILCSVCVYAQYDRNKNEELAQDILNEMTVAEEQKEDITTIDENDEVWVITLNAKSEDEYADIKSIPLPSTTNSKNNKTGKYKAANGKTYNTVGSIKIPSININYPILSETTDKLLKVSVCKFWGANPNEVGNLCIAGHNYRNKKFFSKVPNLKVGDIIEITDLSGTKLKYKIYDKYTVKPDDVSCTSQLTNGKKIVTLITCTNDSKKRVVVKAEVI